MADVCHLLPWKPDSSTPVFTGSSSQGTQCDLKSSCFRRWAVGIQKESFFFFKTSSHPFLRLLVVFAWVPLVPLDRSPQMDHRPIQSGASQQQKDLCHRGISKRFRPSGTCSNRNQSPKIPTSPRWMGRGPIKTALINHACRLLSVSVCPSSYCTEMMG